MAGDQGLADEEGHESGDLADRDRQRGNDQSLGRQEPAATGNGSQACPDGELCAESALISAPSPMPRAAAAIRVHLVDGTVRALVRSKRRSSAKVAAR
jgi:hypothetical protein